MPKWFRGNRENQNNIGCISNRRKAASLLSDSVDWDAMQKRFNHNEANRAFVTLMVKLHLYKSWNI